MTRYRIVQTRCPHKEQIDLLFKFKNNSGYHNFIDQDLYINGWVF